MVVGRQQKCGRVTTGFATCRTRYVLVHNKFATYYFLYTTEYIPLVSLKKNLLIYIFLFLLSLLRLVVRPRNAYYASKKKTQTNILYKDDSKSECVLER